MNHQSVLQWVMRALRDEGFRQFEPRGRNPESFWKKAKGYLVRRALRVIYRLAPSFAIREIRKLDPDRRDVLLLVDFVFTRLLGLIRPSQVRSEITSFANLVKKLKPKAVLEIGTAKGGTLFLLSRLADPEAIVVSVDLPGGRYGGGYPRWKIPLYKGFGLNRQRIHLVRADSHALQTLERVKTIFGNTSVDLLFIDADHTYEGVKRDYELYLPLVKEGGVVAFHDIVAHPPQFGCGVDRYWHEIRRSESREFVEDVNQGWAGIGIL
jgi:predicted O-methyltransferase YrrM